MNKKGFTLIELLAVLVILGIISFIAVPNVVELVDNNKKDTMLSDARKLISQAKFIVNTDKTIRDSSSHTWNFNELNIEADIKTDPDGTEYDKVNSYVTYKNLSGTASFCVYLESASRKFVKNETDYCVPEEDLYSREYIKDK